VLSILGALSWSCRMAASAPVAVLATNAFTPVLGLPSGRRDDTELSAGHRPCRRARKGGRHLGITAVMGSRSPDTWGPSLQVLLWERRQRRTSSTASNASRCHPSPPLARRTRDHRGTGNTGPANGPTGEATPLARSAEKRAVPPAMIRGEKS
jgi:hypothetical protein